MNKYTKGSIAAGAGLILLLGGAGTFMSWNDDQDLGGGNSIAAGNLALSEPISQGWAVENSGATTWTGDEIATYPIVPGDTVTYTATVNVTAEGDNLTAELGLTPGSIVPALGSDADDALVARLTENATYTLDPAENSTLFTEVATIPNLYTIEARDTEVTEEVTVTVELVFPFDTDPADDNATKEGTVNLNNLGLTLTQI